jgi:hypothetical protein
MNWNYRVMRHAAETMKNPEKFEWFSIHEVYYSDDSSKTLEVTSGRHGYTKNPIAVEGDSVEALRTTLLRMLEALDKPILEYE